MATHTSGSSFKENLLRVIAVIGLIAILLLGAWGIIQLAFYLPTFFGNLGQPKEALSVTAPAQLNHNQAFPLSWKHTGVEDAHSYAVSYACAQGLAMAAPVPTGSYQLVPCNTPFNYTSASSSMTLIPVLSSGTTLATTTFTVAATNLADGAVSIRSTASSRIGMGAAATTTAPVATTTKPTTTTPKPSTAKPSTTYVPSGRTQNLFGAADLVVQIASAPQSAQAGSRVTVQFVITNMGTNVAPAGWTFTALLPYNPIYVYPSGGQQALYPGDKIVYTLGYDVVPNFGGYYGMAQTTIEADSNHYIQEINEYNNAATASYQVY